MGMETYFFFLFQDSFKLITDFFWWHIIVIIIIILMQLKELFDIILLI